MEGLTAGLTADVSSLLSGNASQKRQIRDAYKLQGRYAPRIQTRMFDAQMEGFEKHGLHPLWAMGGGGMANAGPPATVGVQDTGMRAHISSKGVRPEEARLIKLQGDEIQERINASKTARAIEARNARRGATAIPLRYEEAVQTLPLPGKPGTIPGDHPAWKKHNLSLNGYNISLMAPAQDTSEMFESVGMWPFIYGANQKAIHKWARQYFKDHSNIGKMSTMARHLLDSAADYFRSKQ